MTPNHLGPYYVQLNYHGPLAPHTMTLPTKNWNASGSIGDFDVWSGGTINALTMVEDLVDLMLPLFPAAVSFDNYTVYNWPVPEIPPTPVSAQTFSGKIGTSSSASWSAAVEKLFIARSTTFGIAKLTLLDAESDDNFLPVFSPGTADQNLIDEWFSDAKGWSARDNSQVVTFLKITKNLNQKLRREYHYD